MDMEYDVVWKNVVCLKCISWQKVFTVQKNIFFFYGFCNENYSASSEAFVVSDNNIGTQLGYYGTNKTTMHSIARCAIPTCCSH